MQEGHWDITIFYDGIDDPKINADIEKLQETIRQLREWSQDIQKDSALQSYLDFKLKLSSLFSRLIVYAYLVRSVDTKNNEANKLYKRVIELSNETVVPMVRFQRWLSDKDLSVPEEFSFHVRELKKFSNYLLSEQEEELAAKMSQTGGDAWEALHEEIWSQLLVTYDGKQLPLAKVRDLAHDKNKNVRKQAFEAELAAYPKIEVSSAACLNNIKAEGTLLAKKRGYTDILDETVQDERMTPEVLAALIDAIKESLPRLRKFFFHKAKLLGKERLAFYDISAPVGDLHKKYSVKEAQELIIKHFATFSSELGVFAKRAIDNNWIDYYPREGKIGGGYCYPSHAVKESRIMMNFSDTFDNVLTLAHELGHAFHNEVLNKEHPVNTADPRCLAETASTFAEKVVLQGMLEELTDNEKAVVLQNYIASGLQTIVDIYSRFLFEERVITKREDGPLSVKECNALMQEAQQEAYGKLDAYHPYMWICKPHYYFVGRHFYNFPYAFGFLFSLALQGISAQPGFVDKYKQVLKATGCSDVLTVGKIVDMDFADKEFWKQTLDSFVQLIDQYISLTS